MSATLLAGACLIDCWVASSAFSTVDEFKLDTWFKAGPVAGEQMALLIADGKPPTLIEPFGLGRFLAGELVGEKGAASVGH